MESEEVKWETAPKNAEELVVAIDLIVRTLSKDEEGYFSLETLKDHIDELSFALGGLVLETVTAQITVTTVPTCEDGDYQKGCGFPKFYLEPGLSHFLCVFRD
jgi:hypothetical protein